jgi:hypothetical protein
MRNANARSRFRAVNVSARRGRNHFPLRELHSRRNTHRLARRLLDLAIPTGPIVLRRQIPSAGRMPSAGKPAPRCWELRNQDVTHYVATAARPGTHRSAPTKCGACEQIRGPTRVRADFPNKELCRTVTAHHVCVVGTQYRRSSVKPT